MKLSKSEQEAADARETHIEGVMAAMAISAIAAYLIGRKGTSITLSESAYYGAAIAAFFGVLYILGAIIVIVSRAIWRFSRGAWLYGKSDGHSSVSGPTFNSLTDDVLSLKDEVGTLKQGMNELLGFARLDGGRIAELHTAFVAAKAERQRH